MIKQWTEPQVVNMTNTCTMTHTVSIRIMHMVFSLPGSTVRVQQLLKTFEKADSSIHCTVVPLFSNVAGTVRVDSNKLGNGTINVDILRITIFWQ